MEISNLSDAQFKTLVIRMLKEIIGYCNSIKKTQAEMKVALSEIKKNLQGTNSGEDEAEIQTNDLEHKEEKKKNIQSEQQEEKNFQKNKNRVRSLWDICKRTSIWTIGVPEGEQEELEIENLFEKIMKENFPNLVKETDTQVQEARRVPDKVGPKRTTPRHIIIQMPKVKDKEIILEAAREKADSYLRRSPRKTVRWFLKR